MRVFVTGGNGFIGSVVVRKLVTRGDTVVCLLRAGSRTERIDGLRYERVDGDISDAAAVAAGAARCDATIHLAAPGGWGDDDPALLERVIVEGTGNVLTAAARLPAHRVVFVSSAAAVASSTSPRVFDERAPFEPGGDSFHYSHAKHRAELLAADAHEAGVAVITVNPAEVYGPGDTDLVTARNLLDFATSTPVFICDGGTSVVHVDDVADGILAAVERGRAGERYLLAGDNLSIRELASLVLELTDRRAPIVRVPNAFVRGIARWALRAGLPLPFDPHVVPYATRYWFMDNTKARRELGVEFRGARATIGDTIGWLQRTGHIR